MVDINDGIHSGIKRQHTLHSHETSSLMGVFRGLWRISIEPLAGDELPPRLTLGHEGTAPDLFAHLSSPKFYLNNGDANLDLVLGSQSPLNRM